MVVSRFRLGLQTSLVAHGQGPAASSLFQDGVKSYSELYIRYRGAANEAPSESAGRHAYAFAPFAGCLS